MCSHSLAGVVYYTLGNLHPKHRSPLKGIHLLNITYYSLIQRYGIDTILEPIIADVKRLEEVKYNNYVHKHHLDYTVMKLRNLIGPLEEFKFT